jgi:hypothetical protein
VPCNDDKERFGVGDVDCPDGVASAAGLWVDDLALGCLGRVDSEVLISLI